MDTSGSSSAQSGVESTMDTGSSGTDWRNQLPTDSRQRIVNKIMETLKRHLPFSGQEGIQELKDIASRFEEKIYTAATSQSDYLRKISLKMLTMETKSQNTMAALPVNSANNGNMGGHRSKVKELMSWPDKNERAFIRILYEYVKAGKLQRSTFTKDDWGKINQEMIGLTKMDYGINRLKGKWNRLRKVHRLFAELVGHTGVTWDPDTNKVDATQEVWQHFFTINKAKYKIFKKEGCKHYTVLGEIFGGTGLGNASTQLPATLEEESQIEDDFLNRGVHVHVQDHDEDDEVAGSHQHKRQCKEPKTNRGEKLDACLAQWSSSVSMGNEETELIMLFLKEKLAHLQGKSSTQSSNDKAQSTRSNSYSTKVCLDILNNMEGVSNECYVKAIKAFKDPDFRMSFVEMPEIRRGPVLELF